MGVNRQWLLKAFPAPEFVPSRLDVVIHMESGRRALVLTEPCDPEQVDELPEDQDTRPCVCNILLGEDVIEGIDVSRLQSTTLD